MKIQDIEKLLKTILESINNGNLIWRLEGSANLVIQGIDVSVNDLDITTNNDGINIFRNVLKKFIVKDFFNKKINGESLICNINGFEVEINSYGDRKLNMFDKTKKIIWQNLEVPILPIKYAKKFYESINRQDKVDLISKYLLN